MNKLQKEIDSFQKVWKGGYNTGYSQKRNQAGLEIYLADKLRGKNLLEIGCGGGQWSKFILNLDIFEKIYCIDVLSEEHNEFWKYLGEDAKKVVEYIQVENFNLDFIEDNSLDYVFSYDVFCHMSYSTIEAYLNSLYKKCNKEAKLLIMYADPAKYLKSEPENRYHVIKYLPKKKFMYKISNKLLISNAIEDRDGEPSSPDYEPRWYWIGIENFINLCQKSGFEIINEDLNIDKTNPITLFKK